MTGLRAILVVLALAACAPQSPGRSLGRVAEGQITVVMPRGAPSITQQFRRQGFVERGSADGGQHLGIDISAPIGTPVLAAAAGVVTVSTFGAAYGQEIRIDHGTDASGKRMLTRYVHLSRRDVTPGQRVARGARIGLLGNTGALAGGIPHLHFEVHRTGPRGTLEAEDPHLFWLAGRGA